MLSISAVYTDDVQYDDDFDMNLTYLSINFTSLKRTIIEYVQYDRGFPSNISNVFYILDWLLRPFYKVGTSSVFHQYRQMAFNMMTILI